MDTENRSLLRTEGPRLWPVSRSKLNASWQIAGTSTWTSQRVRNSMRGSHHFVSLTPGALPGSHSESREKIPLHFWHDQGGEAPFWKAYSAKHDEGHRMTVKKPQTRTLMAGTAGTTKPWGEKEFSLSQGLGGVPAARAGDRGGLGQRGL